MATTLWGIHTKDDYLFLNSNVIAIGWKEFGDLKAVEPSREAFKEHYESVYENAKKGSIGTGAGMLFRFCYISCRLYTISMHGFDIATKAPTILEAMEQRIAFMKRYMN